MLTYPVPARLADNILFLLKADQYMNVKRLKIFQLLSGLMVGMTAHGEINLCENLDWKRSFALHLW